MKKLREWLFNWNKEVRKHNKRARFGRITRQSKGGFGGVNRKRDFNKEQK